MDNAVTIERLISRPVSSDGDFPLPLSHLKRFVTVPWNIPFYHSDNSRKVMPIVLSELSDLNPDRALFKRKFPGVNPFFHHCSYLQYLLAVRSGKTVGRVAAFIDTLYREPTVSGPVGWIGLFECVDDDLVADALLNAATVDLKHQNAVKIIGPARFNANGEDGLLIDGFDAHPMVMEPYHPPYYARFMERWGDKENDWYAFRMTEATVQPYIARLEEMRSRGDGIEDRLLRQGIAVRHAHMRDWDSEVGLIKAVYNEAWNTSVHPQFEQLTDEEFDYLAANLRNLAIEELVFFVEDTNKPGHPVIGMSVTLPDLNEVVHEYDRNHPGFHPSRCVYGISDLRRDLGVLRLLRRRIKAKQFKNVRIFVLGTMRKKSGIDALLYQKTCEAGFRLGIQLGSGSQIADTNPEISNPLARMGNADITWRIYRHRDSAAV